VPDVYRAIVSQKPLVLRYPYAYRPWQHVLDCISGYLLFAEFLSNQSDNNIPALNFGPGVSDYPTVAEIADSISRGMGAEMAWVADENVDIEEKQTLALNTGLAHKVLGWHPRLDMSSTVNLTAEWYAAFSRGEDAFSFMQSQIEHFLYESH
jgi:CDP-glucose 4,6-dehydratase